MRNRAMAASTARSDLIARMYDSALDDAAWKALPRLLTQDVGGESAVLWVRESRGFEGVVHNLEPETLRLYADHYRHLDPWAATAMRHDLYSVAFVGSDLVPDLRVRQTEFYTDFAR